MTSVPRAGQSPDTPEPRVCAKCGTASCLEDAESSWYDDVPALASPGEDAAAPTDPLADAAREVVEFWREGNWSVAVGADEAVGRLDAALAARTSQSDVEHAYRAMRDDVNAVLDILTAHGTPPVEAEGAALTLRRHLASGST